jgi:hypothetical protein
MDSSALRTWGSATGEVSPRVSRGLRVTRDGSMMACLADRVGMSQQPEEWYLPDPGFDVLHTLAYMRYRLESRSVILLDFLGPADSIKSGGRRVPRRSGYLGRTELRQALGASGCFGDISEAAFEQLCDIFAEKREKRELSDQDVNYEVLCEVLQGVSYQSHAYRTGTRVLADKYLALKDALHSKRYQAAFLTSFDDLPFARQPLSGAGERRFAQLRNDIMHTIYAARISARELLGDFDPHLNTSVSWMKKATARTPMINMSPGCISRSQYLRGMHRLAGGLGLSDADLNLIFNKYKKNGAFNYYAFCRDVDPGFDELQAMFAPGHMAS